MSDGFAIIIQARSGSTRLPNKMLTEFSSDKSLLEIILRRLKATFSQHKIVLATTGNKKDDLLERISGKLMLECYRGDENDVLKRFVDCSKNINAKNIIRVCADNPFLDQKLLNKLIEEAGEGDYDYISFKVNDVPAIKTHFGFFAEYVKSEALEKIMEMTNDPFYHEHVTNYIYTHPDLFKIKWIEAPLEIQRAQNIRLTIDTLEDFNTAKLIFGKMLPEFDYRNVLEFINENDFLINDMKLQIEKNGK